MIFLLDFKSLFITITKNTKSVNAEWITVKMTLKPPTKDDLFIILRQVVHGLII